MLPRLSHWYRSTFGHAVVGAAVLWAALPPLDLWPLAWIAPVWWVVLIRREELIGQPATDKFRPARPRVLMAVPRWLLDGRHPYRALWLAGFLFWLAALHWLRLPHWATSFGWVATAFYLGFYLPVFVGLSRVAVHQLRLPEVLAAPIVWTGLELARGHLLTGITMASLGHTQYRWIELIQFSDLAGAYGVSFVVMFVAACLARMIPCRQKPRAFWPLVPAIVVMGVVLLYGYLCTSGRSAAPRARIALIQGCIDSELKADPDKWEETFDHYFDLSEEAVRKYKQVDLIVWPETMFRYPLISFDQDPRKPEIYHDLSEAEFEQLLPLTARQNRRRMAMTAEALDAPLILGVDSLHFGRDRLQCYNSAVFVTQTGRLLGRYDKIHLVVFGEYVPFARRFPWLHRLTPLSTSVSAGKEPAAFEVGGFRIAPNICYESVVPHVIRRQVNTLKDKGAEPDVLVNLTNDGWFWGSSELDMHLICGVFRAVECRKPFLIAANTGFSAWIDAHGRIRDQGPRRATDTILAEVRLEQRSSWYLRYGDWPAGICLAACGVLGLLGGWGRFRPKATGDEGSANSDRPVLTQLLL